MLKIFILARPMKFFWDIRGLRSEILRSKAYEIFWKTRPLGGGIVKFYSWIFSDLSQCDPKLVFLDFLVIFIQIFWIFIKIFSYKKSNFPHFGSRRPSCAGLRWPLGRAKRMACVSVVKISCTKLFCKILREIHKIFLRNSGKDSENFENPPVFQLQLCRGHLKLMKIPINRWWEIWKILKYKNP